MDVGEEGTVQLQGELCCDYCNETIHHHFHCPVCDKEYAGTGVYGELQEYLEDETIFECVSCGAEFQILDPDNAQVFEDVRVKCVVGKVEVHTRSLTTE